MGVLSNKKVIKEVPIVDIRKALESRLDTDDPIEMEKVERYINYIESYRRMNEIVKKEGESQETINGHQRYIKAHPLLGEMNKINTSIMNTEKTMKFIEHEEDDKKPTVKDLI